jgi:hypothetical protein
LMAAKFHSAGHRMRSAAPRGFLQGNLNPLHRVGRSFAMVAPSWSQNGTRTASHRQPRCRILKLRALINAVNWRAVHQPEAQARAARQCRNRYPRLRFGLVCLPVCVSTSDRRATSKLPDWAGRCRFLWSGSHPPFENHTYAEQAPPDEIVP